MVFCVLVPRNILSTVSSSTPSVLLGFYLMLGLSCCRTCFAFPLHSLVVLHSSTSPSKKFALTFNPPPPPCSLSSSPFCTETNPSHRNQDMMDHFEILIRFILIRSDKPAVLLLGHFSPQTHQTHGFAGPDHWHNIVTQFYDVPHVSVKPLPRLHARSQVYLEVFC